MSQLRLSKTIGISQGLLSMLLSGQRRVGRRSARKIAARTGENEGRIMTMTPAELAEVLARIPKEAADAHHE